MLKKIALTKL